MTTSNTITKTDLTNILNEVLPVIQHTARIGEITAFAGSTAPNGWLMCDGSAVSRTTYSKLFAVIGTTYGTGDGSTTFNLPDMRNRFPVGAGSTYSLNSKGGENSHTLTINELPSDALYSNYTTTAQWGDYEASGAYYYRTRGGGQAHENRPPYIGLNFIIYTGTDFPPFEPDRAIYVSTSDPTSSDGNNGDVWFKYTVSS